jgi:hypothetical protein
LVILLDRKLRKVIKMAARARLIPTGECWCGCGAETSIGAFFYRGHDKKAEAKVIELEYGTVADFLAAHGYAPAGKKRGELERAMQGER